MATDLQNEFEAFHRFFGGKLQDRAPSMSLEEALEAFRAYQSDLERFRQETRQSLAESAAGECSPLDIEDVIERGRKRLAEKGITD
jgi:hypothetical protein